MTRPRWQPLVGPVNAWPDALRSSPEPEARAAVLSLIRAWIDGEVYAALGPGELAPGPIDRSLAALLDAVADLVPSRIIEPRTPDDSTVRRWCWIRPWDIFGQDEDILLLDAEYRPWLLEEAAAGCPKRDYALEIVAHGVRDDCRIAVEDDFREHAHGLLALVPLARNAGAVDLVDYIDRIQRYAKTGPVAEAEARSRIHDLTMCRPPAEVALRRRGGLWVGPVDPHNALVIDAGTGAMRIEEDPDDGDDQPRARDARR
jgi:hypothetical protein